MIEINLVPDVKQELLRAQRTRTAVITISIISGLAAIGIVVLLLVYVFGVQAVRSGLADNAIKEQSEKLASVEDLSGFGILSRSKVQSIFRETIDSVLIPGFETYGIHVGPAQEWAGKTLAA